MRLDGSRACHVGATDTRPAAALRDPSDEMRNPGADRRARYGASLAVNHALCRAWHPGRARDDITGARFVRARINHLFDEDDELAYAYDTPERDAGAEPGRP